MTGRLAKMLSNGNHERKWKTTIQIYQRIAKIPKTQPMIKVIKESLKLRVSNVRKEKKKMCWRGYSLPLTGLKRNGATFCGLMKARLFFLGLGAIDSLTDGPQTLNSSHSTLWKSWSILVWASWYGDISHTYISYMHIRDHGSVLMHQNTWRGHVAFCQRGNALEMGDWTIPGTQSNWKLVDWH